MLTLSEQLYQKHFHEGEVKGKAEGEATGMVKILLRLLERRFGPLPSSARSRVAKASADELDVWADQVLDASSLEEMFGAPPGNG